MKRTRCLWLLLLVLLLGGCFAESADQIENTPEYQAGYEQAQTDMENDAEEHPISAWEAFPDEMDKAYSNGYIKGYMDAMNGNDPEYPIPEDEPEETVVEGQDANGPLIFTISDNGDPMDHYTEEAKAGESAETETVNYIANTNTGKFHYPNCSSVNDMKEKNKLYWTGTRDELIEKGYVPCQRCNP